MSDGSKRVPLNGLLIEAVAGMLQRPGRSSLTMVGTTLGISVFVAVLGLTASASGQIDRRFTALMATEVSVQDVGGADPLDRGYSFPSDAAERVERLNGVVHAGVFWQVSLKSPTIANTAGDHAGETGISVAAADPSALEAMRPTLRAGLLFNEFHSKRKEKVAILGSTAAVRLNITRLEGQPAVFVDGEPFTVVGIILDLERRPELLFGVLIPTTTATSMYGSPIEQRAEMIIETQIGSAQLIGEQAALALRPDAPQRFKVTTPPNPQTLRNNVTSDLTSLFLALAAISLLIGAVGIANTTLVAVMERTSEIGLRRALGARPLHIATQFLIESGSLGLLGGLLGGSIGIGVVVVTAIMRHWTAVLPPWIPIIAPVLGSCIGLIAGVYPALRATKIEPVEALRR